MKKIQFSISSLISGLLLASCATPKYKTFSTTANFKTAGNIIKGMSPKEAAQTIGQPMSAYFKDDGSVYYMVYPMGDTEVSMADLMFNDRLECLAFNFEKEKDFKFDGWQSDVGFTCGAIRGEKLDLSLIQ